MNRAALCALVVLVAAQATPALSACMGLDCHPEPKPDPKPRHSVYNPKTRRYMPAYEDDHFFYYRITMDMKIKKQQAYDPDPSEPGLLQIVISGNLKEPKTKALVGVFDGAIIVTETGAAPGSPANTLYQLLIELGPERDDSLTIAGGYEFVIGPTPPPMFDDVDLAITGGTGQFANAMGTVFLHDYDTGTLTVYVPKMRDF